MPQRANEFAWKIKIVMGALDVTRFSQLTDHLFPETSYTEEARITWEDKLTKYHRGVMSTTDHELYERIRTVLKVTITDKHMADCTAIQFGLLPVRLTPA
jgi:hypothetical protein